MRPIHLTFSGLHSYREPVTVDFDSLGRYGLFGIFGRIGSGKSTLLDAITLALYGLVDRVTTRSRKGLVHLGSTRCEVRFRFAVDGPAGRAGVRPAPEIYEVHRAYRDDEGVAVRIASRLVKLGPGEGLSGRMVLAEKETDVNLAVAEVVGLGPDDFMRAVVLPQGRFVQLLHLKGQERRQMLQRIFRLQAYGERLRRQVRDRHEGARSRLASIRGELTGLGDASPAAVRAAEVRATASRAERAAAETEFSVAKTAYDAVARAREHHRRQSEAEAELSAHLRTAGDHADRLARTEAATRFRPLIGPGTRWREAIDRLHATRSRRDAAARSTAEAEAVEGAARARLSAAREARERREPDLARTLLRLEEVARFEAELALEQERFEAATTELGAALAAAAEAEQAAATAKETCARLEVERRRLKREYTKCRVSAEERDGVGRAARAAERVQASRKRLEDVGRDEAHARSQLDRAETEASAAEERVRALTAVLDRAHALEAEAGADPSRLPDEAHAAVAEALAELERNLGRTERARRELQEAVVRHEATSTARDETERVVALAAADRKSTLEVVRGADRALREAENALTAARTRAAAADLARTLAPGAPCTVCGSPHHPAPASPAGDLPEAPVEAHRTGRDRAVRRHEDALAAHARASAERDAAHVAERAAREAALAAELALAGLEGFSPSDADALRARLDAHAESVVRWEQARERVRTAAMEVERGASPLAAARATREAARNDLQRYAAARELQRAEAGEAWAAFDLERGTLTLFDVAAAVAGLEARDRRAEELLVVTEQSDAAWAEAQHRHETARGELEHLREAVARLRDRQEHTSGRIAAIEQRISSETGGEPASVVVARLRTELEALLAEVQAAERAANEAAAEREEQSRAHATADAEARAAVTETAAAWRALLRAGAGAGAVPELAELAAEGTDFSLAVQRIDQLLADQPDDATLAVWQQQAAEWQDRRVSLQARVGALSDPDGIPLPDDETCEAIHHRYEACADRAEAARDQAVAAQRTLEDLSSKTERHADLVQSGDVLDRELGRLDELNQLLRGDRFVEYVANDHLAELTTRASTHLAELTGGRYGLELDGDLGFAIRDEDAGGAQRPVHTLSGGESFLTALSLALALSSKVQERSARPLGFFFLDEGFGTLDPEALERVMTAIERLRDGSRLIGLISHVPAIRERVPRYLWVHPPTGGSGSSIEMRDN